MEKHMKKPNLLLLLVLAVSIIVGCSTIKDATSKGVNVVASVGTNILSLLDVTQPLVQDPMQPNDTNAVVVNPAIVNAATGAAQTYGGPYGLPIAAGIGVIATLAGVIATQKRQKSAAK